MNIFILFIIISTSIRLPAGIKKNENMELFLSKVTVNIANVRYKPDLKSKIIGKLKKNLLVQVISLDKNWAKISLKGFYFRKERVNRQWGFIHRSLIKLTDIKPERFSGLGSVRIKYQRVNIRNNSNTESRIIGSTRKGVILGVLKRDKNWITVIIPELKNSKLKTGFIYSPLVEDSGSKPFLSINQNNPVSKISNVIIITGEISHDLTLYEDRSYVFKGTIKKKKNVKLIIKPGTMIDLGDSHIISEDKLSFVGSLNHPITINTNKNNEKDNYSEIKTDEILFDKCIINGNLKLISKTENSIIKIIESKITGNIIFSSFNKIEIIRNRITNSSDGLTFIKSENIHIKDSLFLKNKTALQFINNKNIIIKYNSFYNNTTTLITDIDTDISENFWYGKSREKIINTILTEKTIIFEPISTYPSENSPTQMYEHILYPEKTDSDDTVELELFFNRDMDQTSVPVIKLYSKKFNKTIKLNINEQEWISARSWFAMIKLPEGIKPGQYRLICSDINSSLKKSPEIIKAPEISVLHPSLINIKSIEKNYKKFIILKFSGEKIFNILLYRQTEKDGYMLYRKWKNKKDLKTLAIPVEFDNSDSWIDFEAFAVNKDNEILTKSRFIRVRLK